MPTAATANPAGPADPLADHAAHAPLALTPVGHPADRPPLGFGEFRAQASSSASGAVKFVVGLLALMHIVNAGTAVASIRDLVVTSDERSTGQTGGLAFAYAFACLICMADALRARADLVHPRLAGEEASRAGLGTGCVGAGIRWAARSMGCGDRALVFAERLEAPADMATALVVFLADWVTSGRLGPFSLAHVIGRLSVGLARGGLGGMQADSVERHIRRLAWADAGEVQPRPLPTVSSVASSPSRTDGFPGGVMSPASVPPKAPAPALARPLPSPAADSFGVD